MALTLGLSYTATAQTTAQKIGKNPTNIASSAVLDIESDNKGVLFPRVALTSTILAGPIVSPTTGLTVFNTVTDGTAPNTVTPGYYYWNGSRWVKLAVETPPIAFSKTVYVNTALPSTATIFDEANPPLSNDNALKSKDDNLYIGNDGSTWTYDNTGAGSYKTYAVAASTPFNLAYTETNAGNNTTGSIWRAGNIGIGINNPLTTLHLNNPLAATNTVNANAQVFRMQRTQSPGIKWENIAQFNLGSYSSSTIDANTRLDLAMNNTNGSVSANVMTWQANGNVGIGTTAPERLLHLFSTGSSIAYLDSSNPAAQTSLDFRTGPAGNQQSWRLIGQGTGNGRRFDIWNQTTNTNALSISPNNNIGIGTQNPTSRLEVNGAATNTTSFNAGANTIIDFSRSNLAYTTANPGAFTLSNLKDGGTYTLAVQGTTAGTSGFTATGFTFKSPNNGLTAAGKETIYTFMVMGTSVYFYMTTGL